MTDRRHTACQCRGFLPPYIVDQLADTDDAAVRRIGINTLQASADARTRRLLMPTQLLGRAVLPGTARRRSVYDMENGDYGLPGTLRRREGQGLTGIADVDSAYDHAGTTYDFYKKVLGRESLDGAASAIVSTVHFGTGVCNAFWDGTYMVYGAGDGELFLSFARSLQIAAHEMSHGVLSFSSKLEYQGETGALNESFCDVMGISAEQWSKKLSVSEANWAIGPDVLGPKLQGIAGVRTFTAEKAYENHLILGTDPQPKHFNNYVNDAADHGSVHTNSGIPNHAFYLVATAFGGNVWDKATRIWYDAFTTVLNANATFAQAASATAATALKRFGESASGIVTEAWKQVGITPEI